MKIVHGDLKTVLLGDLILVFLMFLQANILVSDDGHALITDFGLSSIAQEFTTATASFRWMAPERFDAEEDEVRASTSWDIWSFACLCYEVRTFEVTSYDQLSMIPKGFDRKGALLPVYP